MLRLIRLVTALVLAVALSFAALTIVLTAAEAASKCTISKFEYKKIKKGQTRAKVKKITKCAGKRSAYEGQSQTPQTKLYEYRTPVGHYVFINFKSGKMLNKSRMSKQCWPWGC